MKIHTLLLLLLSFLFLTSINIHAQLPKKKKKKFTQKYKHLLDKDSEVLFSGYYQILAKDGNKYVLKTFNPDKIILTSQKTYKSKKFSSLNGESKEWYDNGKLWKEGQYKNNEKSGTWYLYNYPQGKLESYGDYKKGIENGYWYSTDSIGRITEKYHYVNGQLDGDYLRYDPTGKIFHKRVYKLGEEIKNEILDSTYYFYYKGITEADLLPVLKECAELEGKERQMCGDTKYLQFVYGNIQYPEMARLNNVEGKALIRFVITKKGEIDKIEVLRGICKEIEKECISVIKKSPEWSPGIKDGKAVKVNFNMPINFKLE